MDFKTATDQELRDEANRRAAARRPWVEYREPLEELVNRGVCTDCLRPGVDEDGYCLNRECVASYGG